MNVSHKWCSDYIHAKIASTIDWYDFKLTQKIGKFSGDFLFDIPNTFDIQPYRSFIIKLNLFKFSHSWWLEKKCHVPYVEVREEKIVRVQFKCNCIMHVNFDDCKRYVRGIWKYLKKKVETFLKLLISKNC